MEEELKHDGKILKDIEDNEINEEQFKKITLKMKL